MDAMVQDPEDLAKKIEDVRASALFDEGAVKLSPQAEQFFLLALAALDQARGYMMLAHYHEMRRE